MAGCTPVVVSMLLQLLVLVAGVLVQDGTDRSVVPFLDAAAAVIDVATFGHRCRDFVYLNRTSSTVETFQKVDLIFRNLLRLQERT